MPSTFIFGCLKLKLNFCGIPFPKSIVNGDVVVDKLRRRYKSFFPIKYAESWTLKVADERSLWVLRFSRPLNHLELCKLQIGSCLSKKNFNENMKIIVWPYKKTIKSLTGQTCFPYYGHWEKQESNAITTSCFFVWQFMVHSMIWMSGQSGNGIVWFYREDRLPHNTRVMTAILKITCQEIVQIRGLM